MQSATQCNAWHTPHSHTAANAARLRLPRSRVVVWHMSARFMASDNVTADAAPAPARTKRRTADTATLPTEAVHGARFGGTTQSAASSVPSGGMLFHAPSASGGVSRIVQTALGIKMAIEMSEDLRDPCRVEVQAEVATELADGVLQEISKWPDMDAERPIIPGQMRAAIARAITARLRTLSTARLQWQRQVVFTAVRGDVTEMHLLPYMYAHLLDPRNGYVAVDDIHVYVEISRSIVGAFQTLQSNARGAHTSTRLLTELRHGMEDGGLAALDILMPYETFAS